MRVSFVALCTLTALATQDFTQTASAYSTSPSPQSEQEGSNFVVSANTGTPVPVIPVASPESFIVQVAGQRLADVPGHWAQSFIEPLVSRGIIQGFSDGNFRPDVALNRAQFATIIQQAFQKNLLRPAAQFADVPANYWAYNAIQNAYQMGFIREEGSNLFNPTQNISRVQVLVGLVEGLNLKATTVNPNNLETYFDDAGSIPESARNSVAAAIENRLVVNYPNIRSLNPNQDATRAEVAAFLYQALVKTGQMPALTPGAVASQPQNQPPLPTLSPNPIRVAPPPPSTFNTQLITNTTSLAAPPPGFSVRPTTSAIEAQQADYTLGGGDRIRLDILNVPEYAGEYQVLVNGSVNLPLIGNVAVKGLTLEGAASTISGKYAYFIREPIITVSLIAPRPLKVGISGEVNRPGSYTIPLAGEEDGNGGIQFPTITQAIQLAGGINQASNLRQVLVRRPQLRGADQIIGIDLWALLQGGDLRQDLTLQDGDMIFIPTSVSTNLAEAPRLASASFSAAKTQPLNIAVVGEVSKPGSYTVTVDEAGERATLTKAIKVAGGVTQSADIRRVQIRRPTQAGSEQLIAVDLWQLLRGGDLQQDVILQQGDTIVIPTSTDVNLAEAPQLAAANFAADQTQPVSIAVVGEVARPGSHIIKSDEDETGTIPTITRAIQVAGGITQLADIRQVQVRRMTREGSEKTINVNLWDLLQSGDLRQDVTLQQGDTIVIPTAIALNPEEATELASASFSPAAITVNIVGEVVKPGAVQVPPNTPLNQALLAAGGFNTRARKRTVELVRLNANGTVSKRSVEIDLENGINEQNNPTLRPNDVVIVGKSGLAGLSDTVGEVLSPLRFIFPILNLF
ncbi:SLBB domain-containing protein [Microcoleus sp. FACHB-672]|uniref:SLBB domain-containing protein n=1 Tax=Microcoleus sp. FACHB-672 TaxID=2692825 RepID=UPI001686CA94|nr:SLBB domain-containing protein [Microcoleus sp. FACHB-672]MBD2041648.1 S-layer homology domain-containing protein [Microcoleus sp. FACHB-672]